MVTDQTDSGKGEAIYEITTGNMLRSLATVMPDDDAAMLREAAGLIDQMPNLHAIKAALVMWANWPGNPLPPADKLRALGVLPESVIEWALS